MSANAIRVERTPQLEEEFRWLFQAGRAEFFEDGSESYFSQRLVAMIEQYGAIALDIIANLIIDEAVDAEVASEALRWIGQIENPATHHQRIALLERCLNCSDPSVRDGAILGLSFLDDPVALPAIQRALEAEKNDNLQFRLKQVLKQLTDTLENGF